MSSVERGFFVVDRFEGTYAVLIGDDGAVHDVIRADLPVAVQEGSVLSIKLNQGNQPQWSDARLDAAEYQRRIENTREQLQKLRQRDPGGDMTL